MAAGLASYVSELAFKTSRGIAQTSVPGRMEVLVPKLMGLRHLLTMLTMEMA